KDDQGSPFLDRSDHVLGRDGRTAAASLPRPGDEVIKELRKGGVARPNPVAQTAKVEVDGEGDILPDVATAEQLRGQGLGGYGLSHAVLTEDVEVGPPERGRPFHEVG